MVSHPTPPGPVLHSGTIDSLAAVACDGSPIDVYSPPILSGRLVPSHVMIGTENVTGMQIVKPSMLHVPIHLPAMAVALAPAVHDAWPIMRASRVSKVRRPFATTPDALDGIVPLPTDPSWFRLKST